MIKEAKLPRHTERSHQLGSMTRVGVRAAPGARGRVARSGDKVAEAVRETVRDACGTGSSQVRLTGCTVGEAIGLQRPQVCK